MSLHKIISGGQTGADRAALDFAREHGIDHGGWCPRGRLAEDGRITDDYKLSETPSSKYEQRTEWNIRDSDGTVIFTDVLPLEGGTSATAGIAKKLGKPCLVLYRGQEEDEPDHLRRFILEHRICVLNIAGPRASKCPDIGFFVRAVLEQYMLS